MQYRIVGHLVNDNPSTEWRDTEYYVVQPVDEHGNPAGAQKAILKSRVIKGKIYWPGEALPGEEPEPATASQDGFGETITVNGVRYKRLPD